MNQIQFNFEVGDEVYLLDRVTQSLVKDIVECVNIIRCMNSHQMLETRIYYEFEYVTGNSDGNNMYLDKEEALEALSALLD